MKVMRGIGGWSGAKGDWVNSKGDQVDSEVRPKQ
jgi:hypothetical protein